MVGTAQAHLCPPYEDSNHRELAVDHQQHAVEFMAAAQDQAAGRDHAVDALLARQSWIFFDTINRHFRSAAEHRKYRAVFKKIDGVIAPLAFGDHASVEIEDAIEFKAVECYPAWRRARSGGALRCAHLAWISLP